MDQHHLDNVTTFGSLKRDAGFLGEIMRRGGLDKVPSGAGGDLETLRGYPMELPAVPESAYGLRTRFAAQLCSEYAIASLMLLGDVERARDWVVRAAWLWRDTQDRAGGEYSLRALEGAACIAMVRDDDALRRYCEVHLAVASIAVARGLDLRPAPHPSCPVELFYGPKVKLELWPWPSLPEPDPTLAEAIVRGAAGDVARWRKKSKRVGK